MRTHPTLPLPLVSRWLRLRWGLAVLGIALAGLVLALAARADVALPALPGQTQSGALPGGRGWNPRQTPVVDVVRRVKAAVVNIHSERTVRAPASEELFSLTPSQNRVNGMGTGIVI